jgi:hypothetical protein
MKQMIGILFAGATALSAQGFTTNVSTVAELAGALQYMNTAANAKPANEIVLGKGEYDVSGLRLDWYFAGYKVMTNMVDNFGISYFTLRGATGNPRDVVIHGSDATSNLRLMYNYAGVARDLTFSNCTTTVTDVFHGHNASAIYSNVIVTCCTSSKYGSAFSGTWYDCQFIGNSAVYGGAMYNARAFGCTFEGNSATSGGGAFGGVFSNCTFRANSATSYGGGLCNGVATNCTIIGNTAQYGGGVAATSSSYTLFDCVVAGNSSTSTGGGVYSSAAGNAWVYGGAVSNNVSGASAGGLYQCSATGCVVMANSAVSHGGGTYDCMLSDCLVACNVATNSGGGCYGSARNKSVIDAGSVISNNVCGAGGGGAHQSTISNSRICMNFMNGLTAATYSSGGGVYSCTVTGSTIDGNAVVLGKATTNTQGGGSYASALTNCVICNNYVDNLGGGVAAGTAYGCIISNNACKTTSGANGTRNLTSLVNCDIYEDTVDAQGPVVNCRILNYTNGNVIAEGANVYTNGLLAAPPQLVKSYGWFTNCLFAGNHVTTLINYTKAKYSVFSNCTIADNWYANATTGFIGPTNTLTLINCIVAGNRNANGSATLNFNPSYSYMALTNCVIGSFDNNVQLEYPMSNIITNNNPRFVNDGSRDSYALKTSSPAVGKGLVQDWMADALDVRNDARYPRLRDGLVDIGCYECWLDPVGTYIMFR